MEQLYEDHNIKPHQAEHLWSDSDANWWGDLALTNKKKTGHEDFDKPLEFVRSANKLNEDNENVVASNRDADMLEAEAPEDSPADKGEPEIEGIEVRPESVRNDAEVVGFTCMCEECKKNALIESSGDDDDDAMSDSSIAASSAKPMDPAKGGHEKDLQNMNEHRSWKGNGCTRKH